MEQNRLHESLHALHSFLRMIAELREPALLMQESERYLAKYGDLPEIAVLFRDGTELGELIIRMKGEGLDSVAKRLAALSDTERAELAETERVLNENRLTYHFQPIVSAVDGSIFAYEALMRPVSEICPKPYHILKYAEMTDRMDDIERATFLNVLRMLDSAPERFAGRKIFLNSIPNVKLPIDDLRKIGALLMRHSDTIVVEMTEQTEADEAALSAIKERYRNLGIQLAVDDYGTGYSNVANLLSYMPQYVKIDRSLLTEIQNSPRQRHFVREIIDFCHGNGIMALAEGVETAEELRTVIVLGADLIQGFYTARPAAEPLAALSDALRREICQYRQEREDGKGQQVYFADSSEHVSLERLSKEEIERVVIGKNGDGDVVIVGTPTIDTKVHIETVKGYKGTVTLENVWLSNVKNRPCIDLGEESAVTLSLVGENTLDHGGIRVPESAKLICKGAGKLHIILDGQEYFGIGNGIGLKHGVMIFDQSGCITIDSNGQQGVAIGSGSGGSLNIVQGMYRINMTGDLGLGIGSMYTKSELVIHDCDIGMDLSLAKGAGIGSLSSDCELEIFKSSAKLHISGLDTVGFGTVQGAAAHVVVHDDNINLNIRGDRCTAMGALDGTSDVCIWRAGSRITAGGKEALAFGGLTGDTKLALLNADTTVKLQTTVNLSDFYSDENVEVDSGRYRLMVNGVEVYSNVDAE